MRNPIVHPVVPLVCVGKVLTAGNRLWSASGTLSDDIAPCVSFSDKDLPSINRCHGCRDAQELPETILAVQDLPEVI